jgi:hypothetical protein
MLKYLKSHLLFIHGGYVCCACMSGVIGDYEEQSFWKHVSCIAYLMLCTQLFDPYDVVICALIWWLTKLNLMLFQDVGTEA